MSNDQMDWLIIKGLYGTLGAIVIYLLFHFIKQWKIDAAKGRLLDLEIKEKQTRDIIKNLTDDQLIDNANKAFSKRTDK